MAYSAGDTITFDSHLLHTCRNAGDEDCETIWVVTPAGY